MTENQHAGNALRAAALAALCVLLSACAPSPRARQARGLGEHDFDGLMAAAGDLDSLVAAAGKGAEPMAPRGKDAPVPAGGVHDGAAPKTGADDAAELAKKAQNPVASMISLPLQNNFNLGVGPEGHTQYILNVQPVYPMSLSEDWNWIHRLIVPVIDQPGMVRGMDSTFGLGDINYQGFLSPAKPGKIIWGIGPQFAFPTASDDILGADKWSAGPAAVVLSMNGPWVYGAVVSNIWSFAGDDDREDVNLMTVQPFINHNFRGGWYLKYAPTMTCNWKADSGNRWTVPIGAGMGKILKLGKQPVNISVAAYYNVEHPDDGAEWQLQFQFQFLFPK